MKDAGNTGHLRQHLSRMKQDHFIHGTPFFRTGNVRKVSNCSVDWEGMNWTSDDLERVKPSYCPEILLTKLSGCYINE